VTEQTVTWARASAELAERGWRVLLNRLATSVPVASLERAGQITAAVTRVTGADDRLRVDARRDRVELTIETLSRRITFDDSDVELAHRVTEAVRDLGGDTVADVGDSRPLETMEIAIDALDIPRIRPFWKAVLGYGDEPGGEGPEDAVVDPARQHPTIWFQQMDAPRPQRNRIHFDLVVAHDEADRRREAALAAGGTLVSDRHAPAFWVLADPEGNELSICTWADRERD
jgi:4a-hydroxytetrahydrobiopterin dehydratase